MGNWLSSACYSDETASLLNDSEETSTGLVGNHELELKTPHGFKNLGNTCYLSAVVVALAQLPEFVYELHGYVDWWNNEATDIRTSKAKEIQIKLISELLRLLCEIRETAQAPSAKRLFQLTSRLNPNFSNYTQQDAHEFLSIIIEAAEAFCDLHDRVEGRDQTNSRLFNGFPMRYEAQTTVRCEECGTKTKLKENCIGMSVEMEGKDLAGWSIWNSLYRVERLTDENQFYCGNCAKNVNATKTTRPVSLPNIFVIHYKLFQVDFNSNDTVKLSKIYPAPFPPLQISLNEMVDPKTRSHFKGYSLKSMVIHQGSVLDRGHYICAHPTTNNFSKWRLYDDDDCEDVQLDELQYNNGHSTPYLIFYQKEL
ncbi:Ubiquitin carboxyl-terminal hydrolase [Aphelenchoides besseyi]|nr:Ubiquitin carboxyl-terminal hydrolase [Aphelenchoides besseyi]KAI6228331.1 Ubiquitin carboxyl-terminal hydrolase [Aphelenchoides besseyi]